MGSIPIPAGGAPPVAERRQAIAGRAWALVRPLLVLSVLITPILVPRIAGNTVPADLVNLAFTAIVLAVAWRTRERFRLPFGISYLLILAGGALGTIGSIAPSESALAILQDGYLFVWFVAIVNLLLLTRSDAVSTLAAVWAYAGIVVGFSVWLGSLGYPDTINRIFEYPMVDVYGRAQGTFRDPNMAANYLVLSLFVLWASPRPRWTAVKVLGSVPIVLAVEATESITGLATLAGGALVAIAVGYIAKREAVVAAVLAAVAVSVALLAVLPSDVGRRSQRLAEELGTTEIFADSVGRTETSLELRIDRWEESLRLFGSDVLLGIGPSATDSALLDRRSQTAGELHNDYIAGLLERGVVGFVGVVGLFALAMMWATRVAADRNLAARGWRPSPLMAGMVVILMSAISLETLHFRHVWLFFGLVLALALREDVKPLGTTRWVGGQERRRGKSAWIWA